MSKDVFLGILIFIQTIGAFVCICIFYFSIFRMLTRLDSKSKESSIISKAIEHPEVVHNVIKKMINYE